MKTLYIDNSQQDILVFFCPHLERIAIDEVVTSDIISIVSQKETWGNNKNPVHSLLEQIDDEIMSDAPDFIESLLIYLLSCEDGYIRYDYDEKHHNPLEPSKHPIHHLDIFYSSNITFKIGLNDKITEDEIINLLDIEKECYFLTK